MQLVPSEYCPAGHDRSWAVTAPREVVAALAGAATDSAPARASGTRTT